MFCPSCSATTVEGAKFCKACGFSLTAITQALSGTAMTDPLRDRELKRARKQIADAIQGSAIGAALTVGAIVAYVMLPAGATYYAVSLVLALGGVIKLFKSIGQIIDAKVGSKLLNPGVQPRGTGSLAGQQQSFAPAAQTTKVSQRMPAGDATTPVTPSKDPSPSTAERPISPGVPGTSRVSTGRVYREHSSPLRKPEKEGGFLSKLRG
ncbi:MAG TPA: zinc ribbon domain-containing protein [Blastocatellia bacterium]|nr:zinc ribbon domain-containing protein [Blastocatellia bacterium]